MAAEERQHEEWYAIVVEAAGAATLADCGFPEKPAVRAFTTEGTELHRVVSLVSPTCSVLSVVKKVLVPVRATFTLVRFFQIFPRLVHSALRGISGLNGLAIFIDSALALAGGIKDLAQHDVAPDLSPAWIAVAIERLSELIRRRLIVALRKKDIRNAVMRQ